MEEELIIREEQFFHSNVEGHWEQEVEIDSSEDLSQEEGEE